MLNDVFAAPLVYINEYKAQSDCFVSTLQSSVFIRGDLKLQCGFLNTQGMALSANKMRVFLWKTGTVIPIQSMITHIYMPR
jgi:hypothetical protein